MNQYWPFSGLLRQVSLRDRLIVSLDQSDQRDALKLVERLAGMVGMFKVGKALFMNGGPDFVREVRQRGGEVFLDLRFHVNARAALRAALEATRLGAKMFDLHGAKNAEAMTRVRNEVSRLCQVEGLRRPHIMAVAMLADVPSDATERPFQRPGLDWIATTARCASDAGLDGVITSLAGAPRVRSICRRQFIIVTSGGFSAANAWRSGPLQSDAAEALRRGADYLVIGGALWGGREPLRTVREMVEQIDHRLRSAPHSALGDTGTRRPQ